MRINLSPRARLVVAGSVAAVVGLVLLSDLAGHHGGSGGGSTDRTGLVVAVPQHATTSDATSSDASPATTTTTTAATSSAATGGDDGAGDTPTATVKATTDPAAAEAATAFTAAWLNTYGRTAGQWRAGIIPRVTEDMAGELQYADPVTVPDGGRVGAVKMGLDSELTVADVQVVAAAGPKQTLGTLHLSVVPRGGTWLISEIDWQAAK